VAADLSSHELQRYSRHILLPEIGEDGQRRLKAARVLLVGAGGLGSPAALYLAAAGVGTLGLVDFDLVDFSNLQRQIIHDTAFVGRSKIASARARLEAVNPEVTIEAFDEPFAVGNARALVEAFDVIVDGTDNFPARYLVNDACVLYGKPNVWGSIFRFEGQASVFAARGGPCYRCLHPEPPPEGLIPNCAEAGVLGVLPGVIGTIQANEAIKLILGIGEPLIGRFLVYDALKTRFRELKLARDPECPVCGTRPTITDLRASGSYCATRNGDSHNFSRKKGTGGEMTAAELKARIDAGVAPVILDVREPFEARICAIPGSILIPLGELPRRLDELDRTTEIVVHCKSGGRSARAVALLRANGFEKTANLAGGIRLWINEIDPSLQAY
jgi:molybdopterin/thiamine biosynthesis adenylyltransferase/rhodanese-related sulfurtransferase